MTQQDDVQPDEKNVTAEPQDANGDADAATAEPEAAEALEPAPAPVKKCRQWVTLAAAGSGTAGAGADGVGVAWTGTGCTGAAVAVAGAAATAAPWRNCTSSLTGSKAACSRHASITVAFFATLFATMRMGVSTWRTPSSSCTGVHFCSMASRAAGAPSPVSRSRESCHRASASDSRDSSILAAFPRVSITSVA